MQKVRRERVAVEQQRMARKFKEARLGGFETVWSLKLEPETGVF